MNDFEGPFGDYRSPDKEGEWAVARSSVAVGDSVRGRVTARHPFGVFVDIGVGFPALLELPQFKEARQRRHNIED